MGAGEGVHRTMARKGERIEDKAFVRKSGRSTFSFSDDLENEL